jgi:hypothetical protein
MISGNALHTVSKEDTSISPIQRTVRKFESKTSEV